MEEAGIIASKLKMNNNKKSKFFKITDDGDYLLEYIWSRFKIIHNNPQWNLLFDDLEG